MLKAKSSEILAWAIGILLILIGISHFLFPFRFAALVPPYLPKPVLLVLLSGWLEIFLGVGILYKPIRPLCALGLVILLLSVFPANIHMAIEKAEQFGANAIITWFRLPLQALFIGLAWVLRKEE